jgi:hypothetical protein
MHCSEQVQHNTNIFYIISIGLHRVLVPKLTKLSKSKRFSQEGGENFAKKYNFSQEDQEDLSRKDFFL